MEKQYYDYDFYVRNTENDDYKFYSRKTNEEDMNYLKNDMIKKRYFIDKEIANEDLFIKNIYFTSSFFTPMSAKVFTKKTLVELLDDGLDFRAANAIISAQEAVL